jgi:hypothetical protein
MTQRVYISVTVPESVIDDVLAAVASAGGGEIGEYTHCAFTNVGVGRFKPSHSANPHVGTRGKINAEPEWRLETTCPRERAKAVVQAIRSVHPYEEPVIYVLPLLDEAEL